MFSVLPKTKQSISDTLLGWKFKPTVLDGHPVEVTTEFSSPASEFASQSRWSCCWTAGSR